MLPGPGYPDAQPLFHLRQPRGLDDRRLDAIAAACRAKLAEAAGQPVVFDLIEVVRDALTEANVPSGQCVVCLYGFCEADAFTRTRCFHYLHSYCLARHLRAARRNYAEELERLPAWQQKLAKPFASTCPVCREVLTEAAATSAAEEATEALDDCGRALSEAPAPLALCEAPGFEVTPELRRLQAQMAALLQRQRARGGVIEVS